MTASNSICLLALPGAVFLAMACSSGSSTTAEAPKTTSTAALAAPIESSEPMTPAEIKVTLQSTETSWLEAEARWKVMIQIDFENIGGGIFELDKLTACHKGDIGNAVFDIKIGDTQVQYQGMMKKRVHPGPRGFLRIAGGKKVTIAVDVGSDYAFPKEGGVATIRFDHANHFSVNYVQLVSEPIQVHLQ